jgi:fructose-1,6-bisphosphatase/inositol monophosphatase family enzyme
VPPSAEQARLLLCELGQYVRSLVMSSRDIDMATVTGETVADTIYAIDRVADDALLGWFEEHWPGVRIVSEGLDDPVVIGDVAAWTVIVDTIDGTRGLMYDKRPAWCLAAAAPPGGSLTDVVAAAMTELPTIKQGAVDQLSAVRGSGLVAERLDLGRGVTEPLALRPSSASDLEHSFSGLAKFFLPGKPALVALEAELFRRLGCRHIFDDEYLSTGGQLHELISGRDRFVADLRPLVLDDAGGLACHPYDICTAMLLVEAGGVVTDPWGQPLDAPLDNRSPVAWAGYANEALASQIGPVLAELVDGLRHR